MKNKSGMTLAQQLSEALTYAEATKARYAYRRNLFDNPDRYREILKIHPDVREPMISSDDVISAFGSYQEAMNNLITILELYEKENDVG